MKEQIMVVKGDYIDFMNGNIEVTLEAAGHSHLTVTENQKFNELLSGLLKLLRDGTVRQLTENANSEEE